MPERYPLGSGKVPRRARRIGAESRHDGGVSEPDATVQTDELAPPWWRRRLDRTTVFMLVALLLGFTFVARGVLVGITGDERADLPEFVESVEPVPEAVQTPNQSNVFVDLAEGFTGVLVIDGVEIETVDLAQLGAVDVEPGQQVEVPPVTRYEPGNATLTFTPSPGAPITEFEDGEHTVEVIYWRVEDGRRFARSFTWTFNVV